MASRPRPHHGRTPHARRSPEQPLLREPGRVPLPLDDDDSVASVAAGGYRSAVLSRRGRLFALGRLDDGGSVATEQEGSGVVVLSEGVRGGEISIQLMWLLGTTWPQPCRSQGAKSVSAARVGGAR